MPKNIRLASVKTKTSRTSKDVNTGEISIQQQPSCMITNNILHPRKSKIKYGKNLDNINIPDESLC